MLTSLLFSLILVFPPLQELKTQQVPLEKGPPSYGYPVYILRHEENRKPPFIKGHRWIYGNMLCYTGQNSKTGIAEVDKFGRDNAWALFRTINAGKPRKDEDGYEDLLPVELKRIQSILW